MRIPITPSTIELSGAKRRVAAGSVRPGDERAVEDLEARAIERARAGDADAVHFLYALHVDDIYGFLHGLLRDSDSAERVTQDLFGSLARTLEGYAPGDAPFLRWLLELARREARAQESPG